MELLGAIGAFGIVAITIVICIGLSVIFSLRVDKMKDHRSYLSREIENMQKHIEILKKETESLKSEIIHYNNKVSALEEAKDRIEDQIKDKEDQLERSRINVDKQREIEQKMEETSRKAFQNFCLILEQDYEKKDKEYNEKLKQCELAFNTNKLKIAAEQAKEQEELDKIRDMRKSVQEAQRQERATKEKEEFFKLKIKDEDLSDILLFEEFKTKVKNKRAVSMLIWSTWYQKPMTELCNKILGTTPKCGIYRITNQKTDECYIGQSTNIADRWKQHAKCGLGIDTPAGNKLYKAMQEYGLQTFTWELIKECPREQLNEKERMYIDYYMSKDFGYNSNIGVK